MAKPIDKMEVTIQLTPKMSHLLSMSYASPLRGWRENLFQKDFSSFKNDQIIEYNHIFCLELTHFRGNLNSYGHI